MTALNQMYDISEINAKNRKKPVLIVEDDFINRELLNAYLQQEYEILCAETAEEALRIIHGNSETLSLVLLDLNLPGMKGLDLLREIKKDIDLSRIPVIVLTSDTESEVDSLNAGASDFIPKPYPRHEIILARVRRSIELSENKDLIRWTERDQLTGLYNREYFYRYAEIYDTFHQDEATDALVLDVSHFRVMNERFGRAYADEVLKRIGAELYKFVRSNGGIACRREADTFQVYCPHMTDYAPLSQQVTAAASGEDKVRVHIRIGVYPQVDKTIDMELRFDHAKSAADSLRNSFSESVAMYDESLRAVEAFTERLLDDFRTALAQKQFAVYFQPKYGIRSPKPVLCGAEALVRWQHPELGMIPPGRFIPLFESNGLIRELDHYVWREAAAQIGDWRKRLGCSVPVSVNVSRIDMMDPDLADTFCRLVEENGLSFDDLHLEITESAYTEDSEEIIRVVSGLRARGFKIEMDDFGAGYSSLNMITKLPIDALKLDMMFIRTAFHETGNTGILKIMLDISRYLSVPMIAEGVETEEQMLTLQGLGCDIVQGYYFARPMPAKDFEAYLKSK